MGLGISFIYGVMRMINWAMGEFYMLAGYIQLVFVAVLGHQLWPLAVPLSLAVLFVIGWFTQRFGLKPMFTAIGERREEYVVIVTIAISVLLKNLMVAIAGPYIYKVPDYLPSLSVNGLVLSGNRLAAAAVASIAMVLFAVMLKYTWVGYALRSTAQNRFAAQTLGVDVWRVDNYAFGVGITLAGVAGVMLAPVFLVYPESGVVPAIKGFVILVIGGLGSLVGSLVGGLLLGLSESIGTALLDPKYREVYGFLIMIAVLLLR
ncbi:MAG: branched-chain amino acid ABC transporter permease, partial [Candidatus Caldarchaeum sp.]|nr:branched-chain amino acid ABC transporter permease [Candidatus Caldarchaeum sp.]